MAKYILKSNFPLEKYRNVINKIKISSVANLEIYALAIKLNKDKKAAAAIKRELNCDMPAPGKLEIVVEHRLKILRLSSEQLFIIFSSKHLSETMVLFRNLSEAFYITEQSDAWSGLKISGQTVIDCLERICPINLSIKNFKINTFARTAMEHLNTIIIRNKRYEFEMFSASSSANSFLYAIETSAKNI